MNKKITNRISQSLDSYLVEVNKYPLQTVEEQTELAHRIKGDDEEALAQLITGNLRFVVSVAKQYQNMGKSMEELIEAGNNNPQESLDEIGQSLNLTTRRVEQLKEGL